AEGRGFEPRLPLVRRRRSGAPDPTTLPLGVIGNTPDSGSGESWFDPRRGNFAGREREPSGYGHGLLNRRARKARVGSNPTLSVDRWPPGRGRALRTGVRAA